MPDPVTITFNGETLCIRQWAARIGIRQITLCYRLAAGWSIERALTVPVNVTPTLIVEHKGEALTIAQWAVRTGMTSQTIRARIALGWPVERVLSQPVRARRAKR